ncbi:primase-helicase family protein [Primorskyibacter sp. 2E233]|uniref:primase-helicase family protein n=1 Tax=Primorskyibacter sp. 2E233 TaxID=3413431 RepID=UPI003BF34CB3
MDTAIDHQDHEAAEDQDLYPDMTAWQEIKLERLQKDLHSGVAWLPQVRVEAVPEQSTEKGRVEEVRMEVASWILSCDNKFLRVDDPETRLGINDVAKVVKPMMLEYYADTPFQELVMAKAGSIVQACIESEPMDPRLAFGVWSGKIYPAPGNPSRRLFRNYMWDLNSWSLPDYRQHQVPPSYGAFKTFLDFAIPDKSQQTMLLDWIAWSLQNEANKPNWAILLFSENKGTGKSTIGVVLEALFGAANTAKIDGADKLVATFNDRILDKKLIIVEEVHISSRSDNGNKLKDLITSDRTTVNVKYQPTKTIPLKACYLFTTNHKPLWIEAGERRYYIIEMSHDGHAQGPRSDAFTALVGKVMEQVQDPEQLAGLYAALSCRKLSPEFDPKSMRFEANATPIMRELQAQSGNESDETLEALLAEFNVSVIPSADFKALAKHMNFRNDNSLRNALIRLGWESTRLRWRGKQQRVWAKKGLLVEDGRILSNDLAGTLEGAVENGFLWFPLPYFMEVTWTALLTRKLDRRPMSDHPPDARDHMDTGEIGPFLDSTANASYQTWLNDTQLAKGNQKGFLRVEDAPR